MSAALAAAFTTQAESCVALGSPFMGRLLPLLAKYWPTDTSLAAKCATFSGDIGPSGHSLPLRIAGGLHALVLQNQDAALAAAYPPHDGPDAELLSAVLAALYAHDAFLTQWIDNAPQTNEVRRSAVMIAATHLLAQRFDLPMTVSELGASAGLNMMFDRFHIDTGCGFGPADSPVVLSPDWTHAIPTQYRRDTDKHQTPRIANRRGVDLNPLDPHSPEDALRLLAYLWPDQIDRLERTRAAISLSEAKVDRADAVDWLETRLTAAKGTVHMVYSTVAWQYFPAEAQARGTALMQAAGAKATEASPLAWLMYEADGKAPGAGLSLRLWPGDHTIDLGRADFHGRWISWQAPSDLP